MITESQYDILKQSDKSIPKFSFKNKVIFGKVVKVYDGDTCQINTYINTQIQNELFRFNVRLDGYDSSELKSTNLIEESYAKVSKKVLSELIMDKIVLLKCSDFDKYGRILGRIYINNTSNNELLEVNEYMIQSKLGYPYHGENKEMFNPKMKRGQEAEYFTRLFFNCKETQYKIIPELGFLYRQHEDTKSSKNTIYNKGYKESLFYFLLENFKRAEQLKSKELSNLATKEPITPEKTYRWHSICYPLFNEFEQMFYKDKNRNLEVDTLNLLQDTSIAVWYGDCGSLSKNCVVLNTHIWGEEGTEKILDYFDSLEWKSQIIMERKNYRIKISEENSQEMLKMHSNFLEGK